MLLDVKNSIQSQKECFIEVVITKVYELSKVFSADLLGPACAGCGVKVLARVSSCINFIIFSFVMVFNNKKSLCYICVPCYF